MSVDTRQKWNCSLRDCVSFLTRALTFFLPLIQYSNAFGRDGLIHKVQQSAMRLKRVSELKNGVLVGNELQAMALFSSLKRNTENCMKRVKSSSSNLFQQFTNGIGVAETSEVCTSSSTASNSEHQQDVPSSYYPDALLAQFQQGLSSTPIMLWWEDMLSFIKNGDISHIVPTTQERAMSYFSNDVRVESIKEVASTDTSASVGSNSRRSTMPLMSIQSEQVQLPLLKRVSKAIYEECGPWLLTIIVSLHISLIFQSTAPMMYTAISEICFLSAMMTKLMFKFDKPNRPQPLLDNRKWEDVVDNVWNSQSTLDGKRNFIMGWFYDADFELLRREDALVYLSWMRFGSFVEDISTEEFHSLKELDLVRLESEINYGLPLPRRHPHESPLKSMRFTLEQIRFRHKPLLFYGLTHTANSFLISLLLSDLGFVYKSPSKRSCLGYWHRPSIKKGFAKSDDTENDFTTDKPTTPLVFAHGVGGSSFYFNLIKEISEKTDGDMIVLDLNFVSLRVNDDVPSVTRQVDSVCHILNETVGLNTPATFAGHSYGSTILSWMAQAKPERVANTVFMDPICFQLHLKDILFKFHFKRADLAAQEHEKESTNPLSLQGVSNLAGSELHTNMAMFRHFPWATIELWPSDLEKNSINTKILLSEFDEIVPSREVEELVAMHNSKRKSTKVADNSSYDWAEFLKNSGNFAKENLIEAECLNGAHHGSVIFDEIYRAKAVSEVIRMIERNSSTLAQKEKNSITSMSHFTMPFNIIPPTIGLGDSAENAINAIPANAAAAWSGATSFLWM